MYEYKTLTVETKEGIATIKFNRPEIANAFDITMSEDLLHAFPELSADPEVRVIVVTGAGKNFCAGGNIPMFREMLDRGETLEYDSLIRGGQIPILMKKCKKPIIAMVNGAVVGAGAAFALGADFRVMSPKSRLGMGFIGLGLPGDTGANYALIKMVGPTKALELMMLGDLINGEECYKLGIANYLSGLDDLEEVTYSLAKRLAAGPTFGYAAQKEVLYRYFYKDYTAYIEGEADTMPAAFQSKDFSEAVNAFIEKRRPEFKGE